MTKNSDFKKLVRERMKKTGESYTTARRHLETQKEGSLDGWLVTGPGDNSPDWELTDFEGGIEPTIQHQGKPVAYLQSTVEDPELHGVIMQSIDSVSYHRKRIRFSAWLRCENPSDEAMLWVRVVPIHRDRTFARGIFRATTEWQRGEVVVDVDPRSTSIMFGVSLHNAGKVWMSDADLAEVDDTIPVTTEGAMRTEPKTPANLSFEG